jgi:hypothetical protein
MSSGLGDPSISPVAISPISDIDNENVPQVTGRKARYLSQSTDSDPYLLMKRRGPICTSDIASLTVLEHLVDPDVVVKSRFVSAPLMEARIKLPPADPAEEKILGADPWSGSGFAISRKWSTDQADREAPVPFDSAGMVERDPKMRWSVDF